MCWWVKKSTCVSVRVRVRVGGCSGVGWLVVGWSVGEWVEKSTLHEACFHR